MKKILVPTDFSENALNAANYALSIAQLLQGRVTLLHTYQSSQPTGVLRSMDDIFEEEARREMDAFMEKLSGSEVPLDFKITKGESVPFIARQADNYDLVVMGTQGASGLREVFIGSVTGGVMRHTQTPVLAVPCGYTYRSVQKVGFATASLQLDASRGTDLLRDLVFAFNADVVVFHQSESPVADLTANLEWFNSVAYSVSIVSNDKSLDENIRDFVNEKEIGLLCMVRRQRMMAGFFERLLKDSVTLAQVFHTEIPLLVLHCD